MPSRHFASIRWHAFYTEVPNRTNFAPADWGYASTSRHIQNRLIQISTSPSNNGITCNTHRVVTDDLGPTRTKVLRQLQSSRIALSAADVARELDLGTNTARFHLDALVDAGWVTRSLENSGTPGRPRVLFSVTAEAMPLDDQYLVELSQQLIRSVSNGKHTENLEDIGRRWGANAASADQSQGANSGLEGLADHLAQRGFGVRTEADALEIFRCPFRSTGFSEGELSTVCAMHHGFFREYLAENGAEGEAIITSRQASSSQGTEERCCRITLIKQTTIENSTNRPAEVQLAN